MSASAPTEHSDAAVGWAELEDLCRNLLRSSGFSDAAAEALAVATVDAERRGKSIVGVGHLFDFVDAAREGRIDPLADPQVSAPRASIIRVDARQGVAQHAYQLAKSRLTEAVTHSGIAMLGIGRSYTSGELGYYASDLAADGFVALVGTNSPPLMSVFGAKTTVTGTNPFAFAMPGTPSPRVIDQASSEIAWVSIRDAALRGDAIPEGWAIDADGEPTTDAEAALAGALLPFGGVKGSNVAVVIELLAALSGGRFSLDAPSHYEGNESPEVGTWIIAIDPDAFDPDFVARTDAHFARLSSFIGHEFGQRRPLRDAPRVSAEHLARLREGITPGSA